MIQPQEMFVRQIAYLRTPTCCYIFLATVSKVHASVAVQPMEVLRIIQDVIVYERGYT